MFRIPVDGDDDSPWPIFNRLRHTAPELADLGAMIDDGLALAFMFRSGEWARSGRQRLGACYLPAVQGELRPLFAELLEDALGYPPDWLIILSADWWADASSREREILVFHECLHAGQAKDRDGIPRINNETGLPIPALVPHDVEEFTAVVARYGAWSPDLRELLDAAENAATGTAIAA